MTQDHLSAQSLFRPLQRPMSMLQEFMDANTVGGKLLIIGTVIAMSILNYAPLADTYEHLLHTPVLLSVGTWELELTIHHLVNDLLLAILFLQVGLEVKREILVGNLSSFSTGILPLIAAVGGMVLPIVIAYTTFYLFDVEKEVYQGVFIPSATDIAFSLGILQFLGDRVPKALKAILVTFAIADDLGAILIIALKFTDNIDTLALLWAAAVVGFMLCMNVFNVNRRFWYIMPGLALWYFFLHSGIHATVAAVITAFMVPYLQKGESRQQAKTAAKQRQEHGEQVNPNRLALMLEHEAMPYVAFIVLPAFALANAGIRLDGVTVDVLWQPVTLAISLGLIIGKPLGIYGAVRIAEMCQIVKRDAETTSAQLIGIGALGGIGFTMSIFLASLSYANNPVLLMEAKVGILLGSVVSAVLGLGLLHTILPKTHKPNQTEAIMA